MSANIITKKLNAVSINGTSYSSSMEFKRAAGYCGMEIKLASAISTTITQQCSIDNNIWYDPVDADGNALGQVCSGITADCYKQISPVIAPFIRYKIVTASAVVVTINVVSKEDIF